MVSAMMNNHIASFLVGIENTGPNVRAGACPCPCIVKSASLTSPPEHLSFNVQYHHLKFHPEHYKQIKPQNAHEMPITRGRHQLITTQARLVELAHDIDQPAQAAEHVQRMNRG